MTPLDPTVQPTSEAEGHPADRRAFLARAAGAGAAIGGLSLLAACGGDDDDAGSGSGTPTPTPTATATGASADIDLLNFALNLKYLEAQYYSWAVYGGAVSGAYLTGIGTPGTLTGGAKVTFTDAVLAEIAAEIAFDELQHVSFLRGALNTAYVAAPAINIDGGATGAFTAAARAAGIVGASDTFNPYASENNFLLGALLLEDVGVTALKGAARSIVDTTFLSAMAGMLATESSHSGTIRTLLNARAVATPSLVTQVQALSDARDALDGATDLDQGITGTATVSNIVPADNNGIAFGRTTGQVLNILYLSKAAVSSGGFFPAGLAGNIRTSAASA